MDLASPEVKDATDDPDANNLEPPINATGKGKADCPKSIPVCSGHLHRIRAQSSVAITEKISNPQKEHFQTPHT